MFRSICASTLAYSLVASSAYAAGPTELPLDRLKIQLTHPSEDIRLAATNELAHLNRKAAPALPDVVKALSDPSIRVKIGACRVLSQIGPEAGDATPRLIELLKDADPLIRFNVIIALGNIRSHPDKAVPALQKIIGDSRKSRELAERKVLWHAINCVAAYREHSRPATPVLIDILKTEEDDDVKTVCVTALIAAKPPKAEVMPLYLVLLRGKDSGYLRGAVAHAIGRYGADAAEAVPSLVQAFPCDDIADTHRRTLNQAKILQALAAIGKPAEKETIPLLRQIILDVNQKTELRTSALQTLATVGPAAKGEVPDLIILLNKPGRLQRAEVIKALVGIGDEAVPALIDNLKQESEEARVTTIQALEDLGPKAAKAVTSLEALLTDPSQRVRLRAEYALRKIAK